MHAFELPSPLLRPMLASAQSRLAGSGARDLLGGPGPPAVWVPDGLASGWHVGLVSGIAPGGDALDGLGSAIHNPRLVAR